MTHDPLAGVLGDNVTTLTITDRLSGRRFVVSGSGDRIEHFRRSYQDDEALAVEVVTADDETEIKRTA